MAAVVVMECSCDVAQIALRVLVLVSPLVLLTNAGEL